MSVIAPLMPTFHHRPAQYKGPTKEEVIALRNKYINPVVATYYQQPLMIVEGAMQYVYDETGRRYLDAFAGIATISVGHCHPAVVKSVRQQTARLQHTSTLYLHPTIAEYGKMLVEKMPEYLSMVYFVNSGSEATDLAILMARVYTESFDIIALRNGYHGMSGSAMGVTSHSTWKYSVPHNFGIHHAVNADVYRGPWNHNDPDAAKNYANEIKNLIQHATCGKIAGFIAESIQGVGGVVIYPDGCLKAVAKHVHAAQGLLIIDEVQTGFCRTGTSFWGFESQQVKPDIVTLAKGIGNGVPLAAVVTSPEIAETFTQKSHFNTFAGNPVACAAGKAVLETLDKEKLQDNSNQIGTYLLNELKHLQLKHDTVGDVRGCGLMIGIELVKDRENKEPDAALASQVHELTKDLGLLIGKGGYFRNVLRIKPPLCISKADADFVVQVLDYALTRLVSI